MLSEFSRAERESASTVVCPHCHAPVGEVCVRRDAVGNWIPLAVVPAHPQRTALAEAAR